LPLQQQHLPNTLHCTSFLPPFLVLVQDLEEDAMEPVGATPVEVKGGLDGGRRGREVGKKDEVCGLACLRWMRKREGGKEGGREGGKVGERM